MTDPASNADLCALCDQFESEWKAGMRPDLGTYLERVETSRRGDLLSGLLEVELWWRRKDFISRFPDFTAAVDEGFNKFNLRMQSTVKNQLDPFAITLPPEDGKKPVSSPAKRTKNLGAAPKVIGPYKILQSIGRGGMGEVFMAEQQQPVKRRVALKVISTDTPTDKILARFEAERQALAMMNHQNIAKVLDAGVTDEGKPYFAMELVKGIPITEYCDKSRLTPHERLDLFVQTCRAIQHAHQKGIIHRDLKPSNVLVTLYDGKPTAKVIDFGLAKSMHDQILLTNKTLFTEYGQVVGTLEYMSPEQAELNALDVDTFTDVFSLGVILYELLTGSTPIGRERLRSEAFDRILALIREEEALRPSIRLSDSGDAIFGISEQRKTDPRQLGLMLKGDLDWIAMKALEKDRRRRYDGPGAFADDIERFLNDEMVEARPPSFGYRIQKGYRRNKVAWWTACGVLSLLFFGLVGTSSMWLRAMKAEAAKTELLAKYNQAMEELKEAKTEVERKKVFDKLPFAPAQI